MVKFKRLKYAFSGGIKNMVCPKCGSDNVNTQIVNETQLKDAHHGCAWWLLVGWWWLLVKWLFLTIPALIGKMVGYKKQKLVTISKTMCVCQNCGNTWQI